MGGEDHSKVYDQFKRNWIIVISMFSVAAFIISVIIVIYKILKRSKMQEAILRAELIKQKEAVLQAERKSVNKNIAFARVSHDVRNTLSSITGMIDLLKSELAPESELPRHLDLLKFNVDNLQKVLNTILDTSKVESGKMQLEETEFDISKIIEELVDSSNMKAREKGLEMIWDPCDFSVLNLGNVRGDLVKFKQILDNLLGNAVKYTPTGTIVVRAWAKKQNLKILSTSTNYGRSISRIISCFSRRVLRKGIDNQGNNSLQNDSHGIELTFEVDDTGIGIPVDKRDSVFENYVQVKKKDEPPQGTGLGLGIVRSYVRLMGGEISIQDKRPGTKGACFKFNIFLTSSDAGLSDMSGEVERSETTSQCTASNDNFNAKGVHSLLFIQESKTKVILQRLMERIGIEVHWTPRETDISRTIEAIKHKKSPRTLYSILSSRNNSSLERERFLSAREKDLELGQRKISNGGAITLRILVIVDLSSGNISAIWSNLTAFIANNPYIFYKIVCIVDSISYPNLTMFRTLGCHILHKPVHGSRIRELLEIIQELERMDETSFKKVIFQPNYELKKEKQFVQKNKTEQPLSGKHILLVEDVLTTRMIGSAILAKLGAKVTQAENGMVALDLVKEALAIGNIYDVVFMDCEMPIMDGYEATKRIREEETRYGIRIPIIALSGHAEIELARKSKLSGMDFHLEKTFDKTKLLEAIDYVSGKN